MDEMIRYIFGSLRCSETAMRVFAKTLRKQRSFNRGTVMVATVMTVNMLNGYHNALVQQIKDAGQELINRAESMVHPENDLITDFSIVIHFEQHEVPTIDYTTSVVNKVACDRVIYQKGESNVSKI